MKKIENFAPEKSKKPQDYVLFYLNRVNIFLSRLLMAIECEIRKILHQTMLDNIIVQVNFSDKTTNQTVYDKKKV